MRIDERKTMEASSTPNREILTLSISVEVEVKVRFHLCHTADLRAEIRRFLLSPDVAHSRWYGEACS